MRAHFLFKSIFLIVFCPIWAWPANIYNATPANYTSFISQLRPGDTLNLAAGDYFYLNINGINGTSANWITVTGPTSGAAAVIKVNPANVGCCNLIELGGSSYLALKNITADSGGNDGIFGINTGSTSHDILIENCQFIGQGASQQTVGIATHGMAWNWTIRGNTIVGAGTGLYLGLSDGSAPFVNGIIEGNFVQDTIGYNMEIKFQNNYTAPSGFPPDPHRTIIRNNVFIKSRAQSTWPVAAVDGARPNILTDGFPDTGPGSSDMYEIYGNFFYLNPDENLFQGNGRISMHDNIFVGSGVLFTAHDGKTVKLAHIYNNTLYAANSSISDVGNSVDNSFTFRGNLIFSNTGGSADSLNIRDTISNAPNYVVSPSLTLGSMNFYPKAGQCQGTALDLSPMAGESNFDLDFNGTNKGTRTFRGAYAGSGTNPGWTLAASKKVGGSSGPVTDKTPPSSPRNFRVR